MRASVVIANYNNAKFINDCINSLKSQTYNDIEIIFFDDNSQDNSLEVIKEYKNIKTIENKKQTKFGSFNQMNAFKEAIKSIASSNPDARILICGSLYLAGQVLKLS